MRRMQLLMIVLAIVIVGVAISALFAQGQGQKVTLCHRPPGNPANAQTLTVGAAAAPAHFGHGDTAGACPVSPSR